MKNVKLAGKAGSAGQEAVEVVFKCLLSVLWTRRLSGLMRRACFTRMLANTEQAGYTDDNAEARAHRNLSLCPSLEQELRIRGCSVSGDFMEHYYAEE